MTINTNAFLVSVTSATYPAAPQVVFGSPRRIAAANESTSSIVWLSFDGVTDAVRLQVAAGGFADVGVSFEDFYEKIWIRLDSGVGPANVQVVGEEINREVRG